MFTSAMSETRILGSEPMFGSRDGGVVGRTNSHCQQLRVPLRTFLFLEGRSSMVLIRWWVH